MIRQKYSCSFALFTFMLLGMGCNPAGEQNVLTKEYDLTKPEVFNMPETLKEISGVTFNKGKSDVFYAVQDEEGKVFHLTWKNQAHKYTTFAGKGDFEDIAILKDQVVVLKSNGSLFSFPFTETQLTQTTKTKEYKGLLPKGEYEGMFGDEALGKIYVLCKNCAGDIPDKSVSGYVLDVGSSVQKSGGFILNVDEIKEIAGKIKKRFQPSALAKNPLTGDWFILSSMNKLIVVTDKNWKPKQFYPLADNNFKQPEGITFDKLGNLFISNEGDETTSGNILKFKRL